MKKYQNSTEIDGNLAGVLLNLRFAWWKLGWQKNLGTGWASYFLFIHTPQIINFSIRDSTKSVSLIGKVAY